MSSTRSSANRALERCRARGGAPRKSPPVTRIAPCLGRRSCRLQTLPSGNLGEALAYLLKQWPKLIRYVEDGRVAIDTNLAENAIRPFALGRRNWLFADTVSGAKASAHLYSLVQTARANELEPYAYLRRLFAELPAAQTVEQIEALLPAYVVSHPPRVR
jgi:hypothetical protein